MCADVIKPGGKKRAAAEAAAEGTGNIAKMFKTAAAAQRASGGFKPSSMAGPAASKAGGVGQEGSSDALLQEILGGLGGGAASAAPLAAATAAPFVRRPSTGAGVPGNPFATWVCLRLIVEKRDQLFSVEGDAPDLYPLALNVLFLKLIDVSLSLCVFRPIAPSSSALGRPIPRSAPPVGLQRPAASAALHGNTAAAAGQSNHQPLRAHAAPPSRREDMTSFGDGAIEGNGPHLADDPMEDCGGDHAMEDAGRSRVCGEDSQGVMCRCDKDDGSGFIVIALHSIFSQEMMLLTRMSRSA